MRLLILALASAVACGKSPSLAPPSAPPTSAAAPPHLRVTFEDTQAGAMPEGWRLDKFPGLEAKVVDEGCKEGHRCLRVDIGGDAWQADRTAQHGVDATPYRGRRVRLAAALRGTPFPGTGIRVLALAGDGRILAAQGAISRRRDWEDVRLGVDVPAAATALEIALVVGGAGQAWVDDIRLESVGPAGDGDEAPRPIPARGMDNLVAFARLYGVVRYFHASDEAASADWSQVAIDGVRAVEAARDPDELRRALAALFLPLAPSLELFPAGAPLPAPPVTEAGARVVSWQHIGYGGAGPSPGSPYSSIRHDGIAIVGEGGLTQELPVSTALRGGRVRLRAWVRTDVPDGKGNARLFVATRASGRVLFADEMDDRPIVSPEWRRFEVEAPIAAEAEVLEVGLELRGAGRVFFDDVVLERSDRPGRLALANPGFESGRGAPAGWTAYHNGPGYTASSSDRAHGGKRSATLAYDFPDPDPSARLTLDLGGGVVARLPLAVPAGEQGTLPRATAAPVAARAAGFVPTGEDRATRLAAVIVAWNVPAHFYPYFNVVDSDWPAALPAALASAAGDANGRAFAATLRRLNAALHDGHGRVDDPGRPPQNVLPIFWERIGDALVVTAVAEGAGAVKVGDVVRKLDGRPVAEVLAEREAEPPAATPGWLRWASAVRLLNGDAGTPVAVEVEHAGGAVETVALRRASRDARLTVDRARPAAVATLEPGVMYVDLGRAKEDELRAAMPALAAARGVVFDLRGYPSGGTLALSHLTDARLETSRWMVPVVLRPGEPTRFQESSWFVEPEKPRLRGRIAFLTDGRAVSYAETYMGFVEHYRLGAIIGAPTAGTNGNVTYAELPGGYAIRFTGMKVLKRDGSRLHGVGIRPTIPVAPTVQGVRAGRDEVLERGVAYVKGS